MSGDDLARAVAAGVIDQAAAGRLQDFLAAGAPEAGDSEDEHLRLVSGFGDIFVTIGIVLFLGALAFLTLSATLPWGPPLPLPDATMWSAWLAHVTERLEPLLSTDWETRDEKMAIFATRSEPEAEVQPAADGQLYLTGVKLAAWEGIDLPRQWDDRDREQDEDPYEQLADFVERVWEAMDEWNQSLAHLLPQ